MAVHKISKGNRQRPLAGGTLKTAYFEPDTASAMRSRSWAPFFVICLPPSGRFSSTPIVSRAWRALRIGPPAAFWKWALMQFCVGVDAYVVGCVCRDQAKPRVGAPSIPSGTTRRTSSSGRRCRCPGGSTPGGRRTPRGRRTSPGRTGPARTGCPSWRCQPTSGPEQVVRRCVCVENHERSVRAWTYRDLTLLLQVRRVVLDELLGVDILQRNALGNHFIKLVVSV